MKPDKIVAADIDESLNKAELPRDYVKRIAIEKMETVCSNFPGSFVLAADTAVCVGRRVLGKARNDADVVTMLGMLSGRSHNVFTAFALITPDGSHITKTVQTRVRFKRLSDKDLARYVASKEGIGKAGGYAIQGMAERFVVGLKGSYSNVVGLPLSDVMNALEGNGYDR